jgi:hypothetical protein
MHLDLVDLSISSMKAWNAAPMRFRNRSWPFRKAPGEW